MWRQRKWWRWRVEDVASGWKWRKWKVEDVKAAATSGCDSREQVSGVDFGLRTASMAKIGARVSDSVGEGRAPARSRPSALAAPQRWFGALGACRSAVLHDPRASGMRAAAPQDSPIDMK